MSFSILNEDSKITVVQNNVDQLKNLTISSVTDLQNQLILHIKLVVASSSVFIYNVSYNVPWY